MLETISHSAHDQAHQVAASPADVLGDPNLTTEAKRALLASWASDRHAVPDAPGLRRLDNGAVVSLADVLQALRALDGDVPKAPVANRLGFGARIRHLPKFAWRDPDDDPPPPPAVAAGLPPRYLRTSACGLAA